MPRDNRATPARDDRSRFGKRRVRQDSNPDRRGWSSQCFALHHGPAETKRTTRIERASSGWRPGALPSELRPREHARLESNQRLLPSQDSALSTELRACGEPPAGVEPALQPYKGRVLAVDTTEAGFSLAPLRGAARASRVPRRSRFPARGSRLRRAVSAMRGGAVPGKARHRGERREAEWRRSESNRHLPRCKRGARPVELHPLVSLAPLRFPARGAPSARDCLVLQ